MKISQNAPGQIFSQRLTWQSQLDDVVRSTADVAQSAGSGLQARALATGADQLVGLGG